MNKLIISILLTGIAFGQLKTDLSELNLPSGFRDAMQPRQYFLLDPSRFDMQHSFSMSMMSLGGMSVGVGSYTNQMSFLIKDNLRIKTLVTLMQPSQFTGSDENGLMSQLYYGASLDYKPTENTLLQFSLMKLPYYSRYNSSPFQLQLR